MAICIQVFLMLGVAILNSIGAYIREWPTAYQIINVPHFFMYIAIIYYLCAKEFHTVAWVVLSLITLATVDFMILSKKIFAMETILMDRLGGKPPTPPCGCKSGSGSVGCGCKSAQEGGGGGYPPVMRMIGRPPMIGIQGDNVSLYPLTGAQPTIEGTFPYPMAGLGPRPTGGSAPTPP
jgi:hypothetical protein